MKPDKFQMMTKIFSVVLAVLSVSACGYVTRSFQYEDAGLYVSPVVNVVDITGEDRKYGYYETYPLLLEKKLTNAIVNRINVDGEFRSARSEAADFFLETGIYKYEKRVLSYTEDDDIREQRLRLYTRVNFYDIDKNPIVQREVVGETYFFLEGPYRKSESAAQEDLIEDTARRIVEAVTEKW